MIHSVASVANQQGWGNVMYESTWADRFGAGDLNEAGRRGLGFDEAAR